MNEETNTSRTPITLLLALLLATALAAGAGDDVECVRSKVLTFVNGYENLSPPEYDVSYYRGLYTLTCFTRGIEGIKTIEATYQAWEIVRTKIFGALATGCIDEETLPGALEDARAYHGEFIAITVTIWGRKKLVEGDDWIFNLIVDETPAEHFRSTREPLWSGEKPKKKPRTETESNQNTAARNHEKGFYLITENRPRYNRPRSLKLVVEYGDGTRGFEWRFKE